MNTVFWTNPRDPIAKGLFKVHDANKDYEPKLLKGVTTSPNTVLKSSGSFWDKVKWLGKQVWDNRGSIISAVSSVARFLAPVYRPTD